MNITDLAHCIFIPERHYIKRSYGKARELDKNLDIRSATLKFAHENICWVHKEDGLKNQSPNVVPRNSALCLLLKYTNEDTPRHCISYFNIYY